MSWIDPDGYPTPGSDLGIEDEPDLPCGVATGRWRITLYRDTYDQVGAQWNLTLDELCRVLTEPVPERGSKERTEVWSPAYYLAGARRTNGNVVGVSCLAFDFDGGTPLDVVAGMWAGYRRVLYTSWSHSPEKPKCRLVVPLAAPILPGAWPRAWAWAAERTPGIDSVCSNPARIWYRYVPRGEGARAEVMPGEVLRLPEKFPPSRGEIEASLRRAAAGRASIERPESDRRPLTPGEREALALRLGATVSGGRARGAVCPRCGDRSLWWWIDPAKVSSAMCHHRNSCGALIPLRDLEAA